MNFKKIYSKIFEALKTDKVELAAELLDTLDQDGKKQFLQKLSDIFASADNKAVLMPNCATFFKRKLKSDKSFDEFYQDWLPPVIPIKKNDKAIYDYYSMPTRVINFKDHDRPDEFYTLAMICSPYANPSTTMEMYKAKYGGTDAIRRAKNEENLEESALLGFGSILSDDIFGI